MWKKTYLASVLVFLAMLVVLNMAVAFGARNTIPRQIARRIDTTTGMSALALGNSLVEAGFDAPVFQNAARTLGHEVVAVNAGMGSSTPVEHVLFLRRAVKRPSSGLRKIYYGFYDFQLMEPAQTNVNSIVGNRSMLYYFEPDTAAGYYRWSLLERLRFHLYRWVPALRERGAIWAKIERLRRELGNAGMPAEASNQFGRVNDFNLLENANPAAFAVQCDGMVSVKQDLSPPIADMIRMSKDSGIQIVMVEMPMSSAHVATYYETPSWRYFRGYLSGLLTSHGAEFISAGDWIKDESMFADHFHLAPAGAVAFSRRLALSTL